MSSKKEEGEGLVEALSSGGMGLRSATEAAQVQGWVSTGNYALNWAISNRFASRGWPLGVTAELFGDESTGKTFLLARAIAAVQEAGGLAFFDDAEGRFSADWASRKLGVDTDELLYAVSDTVEDHQAVLDEMLDKYQAVGETRPLIAALDSLGALSTKHEIETDFGTRDMTKAYMVRKLFRTLRTRLQTMPVIYLAANHQYAKIGASPWEKKTVSSGGGGFKYQSSIRISMRTPKTVKGASKEDDARGVVIRAVVEKNSVTVPYRETSIMIPFAEPISASSGLVPKLLSLGYLTTTKGHRLVWQEEDTDIPANKTDLLGADESAEALLDKYPDLLEAVDADLARQEGKSVHDRTEDEDD